MVDPGVILGAIGIGAAIVIPTGIETFERPRLDIRPSPWSAEGPVDWTFATVRVRNKPTFRPVRKLLTRQAAQACVVELEYFRWGTDDKALPTIPGRWSSHPQPIRYAPFGTTPSAPMGTYPPSTPVQPYTGGTASTVGVPMSMGPAPSGAPAPRTTFDAYFDASLDSRQQDVTVGPEGEEVAVAILTTTGAYAFSTDSYAHYGFRHPGWWLPFGSYRIVVRVHGSSVNCQAEFRLDYNSGNFSDFRLKAA